VTLKADFPNSRETSSSPAYKVNWKIVLTLSRRYVSIHFDARFNYHTRYMSRTFDGALYNVKLPKSA
jgi:hypothetical protein